MKEKILLREFAKEWLEVYKKHSGIRKSTFSESYQRTADNYLLPEFGERDIKDITPMEIRIYLNRMGQKYSKSTISKILLCLNQIYAAAVENRLCDINPTSNITACSEVKCTPKRTYSAEEVDQIILFAERHEYGIYIRILLELGLRCSELCGLQWGDVDCSNQIIHIRRGCTSYKGKAHLDYTKNDASRRVLPMSTKLAAHLSRYQQSSPIMYVAPSKRNPYNPLTPSSFTKGYYDNFFADYGMDKRLTPHELRHTCGTLLYARSHDIYAVSKFMGHSSIAITTKLYVHPDPEMLRNALSIE